MEIKKNEPLAKYTTFKIGGNARHFVTVKTKDEMIQDLNYAFENKLKYFILGGGANVLFKDEIYDGLIIKNEAADIKINGDLVEADSGIPMNLLVNRMIDVGLGGLEYFAGHPGTVGGSIYINAHTKDTDGNVLLLGEKVVGAKIFNINSRQEEKVSDRYFNFSYDYSELKKTHDILLSVTFSLEKSDPEILKTRAAWIKKYRLSTQEYGGFTAGCVFQNPAGKSAGALIDQCGLKGLEYGGAKVSLRHANFIVNTGQAKASDVLYLIDKIKKKVKEKFEVELREEIVIV